MSACSASRCELTETYSPTAIDIEPATRPATPATRMAPLGAEDAATPIIRLAVETIASSDPRTAARSHPERPLRCISACSVRLTGFVLMDERCVPLHTPVLDHAQGDLAPGSARRRHGSTLSSWFACSGHRWRAFCFAGRRCAESAPQAMGCNPSEAPPQTHPCSRRAKVEGRRRPDAAGYLRDWSQRRTALPVGRSSLVTRLSTT